MTKRSYVLDAFVGTPWAIMPSKLAILEEIVIRHVSGEKLEAEEIQARIQGATPRPQNRQVSRVAVLPLFGTIIPRADMFEEASGATSAEKFGRQFAELVKDPSIDAIVLDVDSPGGQVGGIEEVSKQIYDARGTKPIIAVANQLMASAAYWIGTAADELVVTPSGQVGSVGVFSVHNDMSAALDKAGLKLSIISAGRFKVEGNPYEPLTEEARAAIQARVVEVYDTFVNTIARNRGTSPDAVRNGFGEGRVVSARQAVELGMADRVATLDETINGLLNGNSGLDTSRKDRADQQNKGQLAESGQAPASDETQTRLTLERAQLAVASEKVYTGESTMLRELIKQRSEKVARAQALVEGADKETRDMNEAERKEFVQLLGEEAGKIGGEIGALDQQIEKISGERESLRAAAEKKLIVTTEAQKPEGNTSNAMKRAEYAKLDQVAQAAYIKGGGKLED